MALPYSRPHFSGQWTPSSVSCCFGPQTKFAMASVWPWVSELSEQEVSKAWIGTCPLHSGDAFKLRLSLLGSARAMLELCLCLATCLAAPWLPGWPSTCFITMDFSGGHWSSAELCYHPQARSAQFLWVPWACALANEGAALPGSLSSPAPSSPPFTEQPSPANPFW